MSEAFLEHLRMGFAAADDRLASYAGCIRDRFA